MGRKPNALILQHFERGEKLNDSSNRYQHTCKACGEKFPKGRIDSLTNHLVKKCPAISLHDRQKALLELNGLSSVPDPLSAALDPNGMPQMNGPTVELPLGIGNRDWTALETLAEVSRQIGTNESHDGQPAEERDAANGRPGRSRGDRLEVQEQYTLENPPVSYEHRVQREKKGPNQKAPRRESENSLSPASFSHVGVSRSTSPLHVMAATSMAQAAAARFVPSMVDPQLLGDNVNAQDRIKEETLEQQFSAANAAIPDSFYHGGPPEQQPTWPMIGGPGVDMYPEQDGLEHGLENSNAQRAGTYPRLAMSAPMTTEFATEYGNGQKAQKHKVRGRFNPTRRKEVQEVRKMGACLRCKMLKKPCSSGTPCDTCKSVETARLWKQPCVRAKIADELDMYSAGLHAVLAYHETSAAKAQVLFRSSPNQIEASHYPETAVFGTFKALEGQQIPNDGAGNIDPGLSGDFTTTTLRMLDVDNDDLPMKVEAYMKRMMSVYFDREPSTFMNVTLSTALKLSIEKQDTLLTRVLELWAIVHILVDGELEWKISERVSIDAQAGQGPAIERHIPSSSWTLLVLQLNAAAEKKAAQICKGVLHDLEHRLLQRNTASSFETFLVSLVMLNCVEKSTWLFKSWEQEKFKSRWPLDKSPAWYASQGEKITDMLQMLLRMRSVPPKTYTRPETGILATDADPAAQEYFEKVQLGYADVLDKQANYTFDPSDSRCYELRFCSRLLLPSS